MYTGTNRTRVVSKSAPAAECQRRGYEVRQVQRAAPGVVPVVGTRVAPVKAAAPSWSFGGRHTSARSAVRFAADDSGTGSLQRRRETLQTQSSSALTGKHKSSYNSHHKASVGSDTGSDYDDMSDDFGSDYQQQAAARHKGGGFRFAAVHTPRSKGGASVHMTVRGHGLWYPPSVAEASSKDAKAEQRQQQQLHRQQHYHSSADISSRDSMMAHVKRLGHERTPSPSRRSTTPSASAVRPASSPERSDVTAKGNGMSPLFVRGDSSPPANVAALKEGEPTPSPTRERQLMTSTEGSSAPLIATAPRRSIHHQDVSATTMSKPTTHMPPVYTLTWMYSAGSVYQLMADRLLERPEWKMVCIDTRRRSTLLGGMDKRGPRPWSTTSSRSSAGGSAHGADANAPCCDRLEHVNLFLGDKLLAEELLGDARKFALRKRRGSAQAQHQKQLRRYMYGPAGEKKPTASTTTAGTCTKKTAGCIHRPPTNDNPNLYGTLQPPTPTNKLHIVNYFEGTRELTLKAKMVRTLRMHIPNRSDLLRVLPETFVLIPSWTSSTADERHDFLNAADRTMRTLRASSSQQNATRPGSAAQRKQQQVEARQRTLDAMWIAKSSHGSHGEGIRLFGSDVRAQKECLRFIDDQAEPYPWVVQKYISRPLLVKGRKFDIRYWGLLKSPHYQIYLHRDGVMRTSSELYHESSALAAHVTNHCLQKEHSDNYSKYEDGNELWVDELGALVNARGLELYHHANSGGGGGSIGAPLTFQKDVLPQIRHITTQCLLAVKGKVEEADPRLFGAKIESFQLFGFDFLIDDRLHVTLLEVNGCPGIAEKLHGRIVDDLIELTVEPSFPSASAASASAVDTSTSTSTTPAAKSHVDPMAELPTAASGPTGSVGTRPSSNLNGFELIYPLADP